MAALLNDQVNRVLISQLVDKTFLLEGMLEPPETYRNTSLRVYGHQCMHGLYKHMAMQETKSE